MQDAKEEVRARLAIEDVIGEYVQLKRAGRNFKGTSPFNDEKTPSFFVSPEKAIWHDFSSNKGGDIFSFVMEAEGMDFRQALEHLARKAGVDLSIYKSSRDGDISRKKRHLQEINDLAARYYQQSLLKNQHALDYVCAKRKFNKETINQFQIGYAPTSGDALVAFLLKKGYNTKDLGEAGLTNRFGGDLFRGRMMVPLMDSIGQVVGFTARTIVDDPKSPKYLNTPQTLLYDKSRHVFGLSQAKEAIRTSGHAVIVEGNLDVLSSHQVGVRQVVATAGTAMTEYHLRALKRFSGDIRLAFDGDKAGLAATERAITIAQDVDVNLTIISMPEGIKDPDELIQRDSNLWTQAIEQAVPAIDWLLAQYLQRENIATAIGKRSFTTSALNIIDKLKDPVEREYYLKVVAEKADTSLEALQAKAGRSKTENQPNYKKVVSKNDNQSIDSISVHQDNLLALALIDDKIRQLFHEFDASLFQNDDQRVIAGYIAAHPSKKDDNIPKELQKSDSYVNILLLKAEARYADWSDQDRYYEAVRLLRQVVTYDKKQQKDKLTDRLRLAEESGDDQQANDIRSKLNNLIKEIQSGQKEKNSY